MSDRPDSPRDAKLAARARRLGDELHGFAKRLAPMPEPPFGSADQGALAASQPELLQFAKRLVRARRAPGRLFEATYFADPAWDILLDLFIAAEESRKVSVSSVCIAANVPGTTALRWLKTLESAGEIVRVSDPRDGRRSNMSLSEEAYGRMVAVLTEARQYMYP